MRTYKIIRIILSFTVLVFPSLAFGVDLPRDTYEQSAFDSGCDKNQMNMNICSYYDFKVLDTKLNEVYRTQIERLKGTPHEKRLIHAQRAWLNYVEADCLYQNGPREESGSIWSLEQNTCKSAHFNARIKLLESFLECTSNGCPGV
ncbi:MAG: hypothetical protein FD168_2361 [Desulfobulbaceae bacterium]|nr:MAG: hypothetical protein FD168_2361 [Desulfobulbaceae bacterium]